MQIDKVTDNIWYLLFENQYKLCSTLMRMQEFYESPLKNIRGKVFTLEQFMDSYAAFRGDFSYTSDWGGFNVPGNVVRKFFEKFSHDLLLKEKVLKHALAPLMKQKKFYVIAGYERGKVFEHELAHAFYYLRPQYKKDMLKLEEKISKKKLATIHAKLKKLGYDESVYEDEVQAYLSTSDDSHFKLDAKTQKLFTDRFKAERSA